MADDSTIGDDDGQSLFMAPLGGLIEVDPPQPSVAIVEEEEEGEVDASTQQQISAPADFLHRFVSPSPPVFESLVADIRGRLESLQGEMMLELGFERDGSAPGLSGPEFDASLSTLQTISHRIEAESTIVYRRLVPSCRKKRRRARRRKKQQQQGQDQDADDAEQDDTTSTSTTKYDLSDLFFGEVLIRTTKRGVEGEAQSYVDLRIAIVGNVDSGKSTTIGVLTRGHLDNGRGSARAAVFNYKHELDSGRTSSVSLQILGFDESGSIVNYEHQHGSMSWNEICSRSSKIVTFVDLAGHEKYLKTTMYGCTAAMPDYACLVVGSNMGVTRMTKEHLGICLALKIPFFILVTKIDLCPRNVLRATLRTIQKILKHAGVRKIPFYVKKNTDIFQVMRTAANAADSAATTTTGTGTTGATTASTNVNVVPATSADAIDAAPVAVSDSTTQQEEEEGGETEVATETDRTEPADTASDTSSDPAAADAPGLFQRLCPIFLTSNVTGEGLPLLRKFLNLLPKRRNFTDRVGLSCEFFIDGIYYVTGVGTVVSGVVNQGEIRTNDSLSLGPDGNGVFRRTVVKSIHCKRVPVPIVSAGTICTLALKKEKRNHIRKGMVLLGTRNPRAYWEFEAEVLVLYHSTTIRRNYQPVIHTENIRQSARIVQMDRMSIRTGDKARVKFRFMCRPEYVKVGSRLIFREGRTKGIGQISALLQ